MVADTSTAAATKNFRLGMLLLVVMLSAVRATYSVCERSSKDGKKIKSKSTMDDDAFFDAKRTHPHTHFTNLFSPDLGIPC